MVYSLGGVFGCLILLTCMVLCILCYCDCLVDYVVGVVGYWFGGFGLWLSYGFVCWCCLFGWWVGCLDCGFVFAERCGLCKLVAYYDCLWLGV